MMQHGLRKEETWLQSLQKPWDSGESLSTSFGVALRDVYSDIDRVK